MNRQQLGPEEGMIFIWENPVRGSFWMKDTLIPLSIAFVTDDGVITDIQEMEALSTQQHYSAKPYVLAIEANKGWFSSRGITVGDSAEYFEK